MSDAIERANARAADQRARGVQPKKASEILRRGPQMRTLGIYLPEGTIAALKRLAFEEDTSVSAIVDEAVAPRIADGPRPKTPERPRVDLG